MYVMDTDTALFELVIGWHMVRQGGATKQMMTTMSKHEHSLNVECPNCHHVFDVEASLSNQIEKRLKADLAKGQQKALDELAEQRKSLAEQQHQLDLKHAAIQQQVDLRVKQEREAIKTAALKEAQAAQQAEYQALLEKSQEQGRALSQLKQEQLALLKQKEKLDERAADLELEAKKTIDKERKRIEEEVKQREAEAHRMKDREKDLVMEKLKEQVEDMKRRMEQGSMQVQGEAQELELRELLEDLFRSDTIDEVATGANGADVLQHVFDRLGRSCGTIAFESKRTKAFSDKWIDKLKEDMHRHKAEVGVIVTEAMPKDMPNMGLRNGVFVCSFQEVAALAQVLRQSVLRIAEVRSQEENKDDKANLLYAYFTSSEFKQRMQTIVSGYTELQEQLAAEKRAMTKLWKAREAHIDRMLTSATELQGSILGIAGHTHEAIAELDGKTTQL